MRKKKWTAGAGLFKLAAGFATCSLLLPANWLACSSQELTSPSAQADTAASVNGPAAVKGTTDGATLDGGENTAKVIFKPGQPISVNMATEDLQPTDNVEVATEQFAKYSDSPEAAFLLAVALTRTSRVEDALRQVRVAKNLAQKQGGAAYFDKMISSYEHMLQYCPDDNRIRYTLAWAYYMKAYVLSKTAQAADKAAGVPAQTNLSAAAKPADKVKKVEVGTAGNILSLIAPQLAQNLPADGKVSSTNLPHFPSALAEAPPSVEAQVKGYYDSALKNLDDLLARKPDDIWARLYRAYLYQEETGDLASAMKVWRQGAITCPQNPAPYFFLGTGYLRQGNLKESIGNVTRAIGLRAIGN